MSFFADFIFVFFVRLSFRHFPSPDALEVFTSTICPISTHGCTCIVKKKVYSLYASVVKHGAVPGTVCSIKHKTLNTVFVSFSPPPVGRKTKHITKKNDC